MHPSDYAELPELRCLYRGTLAGLRVGTYTVSADLQVGGAIAFNLRVTDSKRCV